MTLIKRDSRSQRNLLLDRGWLFAIADSALEAHLCNMNPYADLDPAIEACVKANRSTLFTDWAGAPARFFHLPGQAPFECFQISIDQPRGGRVAVFARSIDTNDGSELEQGWEAPIDELSTLIAEAVGKVRVWEARLQRNGD